MQLDGFDETGLFLKREGDAPLRQFQVLGERACATNLVRKLIEKNLQISRCDAMGWKHAVPHMVAVPADFLIVVAVRDAVSWALSMHKRPWHLHPKQQEAGFSDFLRAPWHGVVDRESHFEELHSGIIGKVKGAALQFDLHPITGLPFENLFALRNLKLAAYLGLLNRGCNVMFVRAETVQKDPAAFVDQMALHTGVARKSSTFNGVSRRMGNRYKLAVDPATREATPKDMSEQDRRFMRDSLNLSQEARLGYVYD